ncbi:MAG: Na+/H+ antiporter, partial [Propionibacteriaceae bacterium]
AGFRGAVSLAVALSVPTTLSSGQPFPDRDLVVFITAGVVASTLVVQGLLLPYSVRWAHLPVDEGALRERQFAEESATEEALRALPQVAAELGTESAAIDRLRTEFEEHLQVLQARETAGDHPDSVITLDDQYTELRLALLARKRATVLALRDERKIDDAVLREIQAHLDIEELRLTRDEVNDA